MKSHKKTSLFDMIIDRALGSSRTVMTLANDMLILAQELNSLKQTVETLARAIQIQQIAMTDLLQDPSATIDSFDSSVYTKNNKKEEPN